MKVLQGLRLRGLSRESGNFVCGDGARNLSHGKSEGGKYEDLKIWGDMQETSTFKKMPLRSRSGPNPNKLSV